MAIQSNFPAIKPSLLLDFANTKQLDPRITYTRASTATFYNGVTTAMAEQNLLLQSQTFETTWTLQSGSTITANTSTAPDGTTTADTFNEGTGSAYHDVEQSLTLQTGAYTVSCYMKYVDQQYGIISLSSASNAYVAASFDLIGGTVSASSNSGALTTLTGATITSVGGSWYRCTVSGTVVTAGTFVVRLAIATTGTIGAFGIGTYTGTSKTALFWGAQLEQRSAVSAYTVTTTQAITNYIPVLQTAASGVARFDNNPTTGESLGLLIEESRTNLTTYSSDFSNAVWTKTNSTITSDTIVGPDGTLIADKLVPSTASSGNHSTSFTSSTLTAASYTYSVFAKAGGYNFLVLKSDLSGYVEFNLSTGAITLSGANYTGTATSVGNGWYRCSITFTATAAAYTFTNYSYAATGAATYTGDGFSGAFIWGAQLEAGAFATSYIPTVASQVTRAADAASMTGTNFSSWYNSGEGTFYAEANIITPISAAVTAFTVSNGTTSNRNFLLLQNSSLGPYLYGGVNGTAYNYDIGTTATGLNKLSFAYSTSGSSASINSATVVTNSVPTSPVVDRLNIGSSLVPDTFLNNCIKKLAYYPIKITNANLQALTS